MRTLDFTVKADQDGWSVEHFLREELHFSKKQISRLKFREEGILVNGKQARTTCRLSERDLIRLTLDTIGKRKRELTEPAPESEMELPEILYEDRDLLVVSKPGGIPVHPSHGHFRGTLWNRIVCLQKIRREDWTPRLVGRLDKDTSGIILIAKNTETAAALAVQREDKVLRKWYLARAEGNFPESTGVLDQPVGKEPGVLNRMQVLSEEKGGRPARTLYRVRKHDENSTLLELELEHGRTHQIRVHLSAAGHPVVGDSIYGHGIAGQTVLCLHAWKLELQQPFTDEKITITAPLPDWCENITDQKITGWRNDKEKQQITKMM